MSIFDGNRELTGEVFRQYKFSEFASKDGWFNTILNRNLPLVIYLHIVEDNNSLRSLSNQLKIVNLLLYVILLQQLF